MKAKNSLTIALLFTAIVLLWSGLSFAAAFIEPTAIPKSSTKTPIPPSPTPTRTITPAKSKITPPRTPVKTPSHALIHFNLANTNKTNNIPATAFIISAKLSLYVIQTFGVFANQVNIYKIIDPDNLGMWSEDGAAFLRRDGVLGMYTSAIPWTMTSGSSIRESINHPPSGMITLPASSGWVHSYNGSSRGLKDDVQDWLANPELNQGWFLESIVSWDGACYCVSRHDPNHPALSPKLVVEYSLPPSTTVNTVSFECDADIDGILPNKDTPEGYYGSGQSICITF